MPEGRIILWGLLGATAPSFGVQGVILAESRRRVGVVVMVGLGLGLGQRNLLAEGRWALGVWPSGGFLASYFLK